MRKYGKWVLTLGLLAATPSLTLAAGSKSKDASPAAPVRSARTDNQRVAEDIANALRGKVKGDISIEFKDGVAVLSGTVLDAKVKKTAESLAENVTGVTKVDNRLSVVPAKRGFTERLRGDGTQKGVTQAAHAGEGANHKRVQQVNSEYSDDMALPGPDDMSARGNAAQAKQVNQQMAEQVGLVLSAAQLDGYEIQIRFQNGIVTLDGTVGTQAERALAEREVQKVQGVRSVSNRLHCINEPQARFNPAMQAQNGYGPPRGNVRGAGYMQPGAGPAPGMAPAPGQVPGYQAGPPMGGAMPMGPGAPPYPPAYGNPGMGASQAVYNSPNLPDYAWPTYAQYPNSAAVSYPQQYSASAWPYIGPFYPYPQVPLGWRDATLRWDDGQWNLMFKPRTDRWWWFLNPNNW